MRKLAVAVSSKQIRADIFLDANTNINTGYEGKPDTQDLELGT